MFNKNFCFILLIINFVHNGESVNYYPYSSNILPQSSASTSSISQPQIEHHLLHGGVAPDEFYNPHNAAGSYSAYQQNHAVSSETNPQQQTNRNYQELYRFNSNNEATPLRQQPSQQPQQPHTQLWSGPPIVVGDDDTSYLTSNIPQQATYNTPPLYNTLRRHSKALPVQQRSSIQQQLNFANNNNNNIVYHRDFRHEIDALPATLSEEGVQPNSRIYTPQQQQQQQYEEKPQQFYESITNTTPYDYALESRQNNFNLNNHQQYDSKGNYYASLRRDDNTVIDYTDYFKRYLENNPRRIQPLY